MSEEATTNIGYWQKIVSEPPQAFKKWFDIEKEYLLQNIPENGTVLDLGCGNGKNIEIILKKTKKVFGVDNDPIAVQNAKNVFKDIPEVQIILGDASQLSFEENSFDVVMVLELIGNVGEFKDKIFSETKRVLKNNGIIILSIYAETAFEERMRVYKESNCPIKEIVGTTVYFDESVGANISEQFSLEELISFGEKAGLEMVDHIKVGDLAYICKYKKK